MEEKVYSVSEAVRLVGVESHVLRYWEEELNLLIHRNALGHRIYGSRDIELLCRVKEWKERGLQLKAIRVLLQQTGATQEAANAEGWKRPGAYEEAANAEGRKRPGAYEEAANAEGWKRSGAYEEAANADGQIKMEAAGWTADSEEQIKTGAEDAPEETYTYEIVPSARRKPQENLDTLTAVFRQIIEETAAEQTEKLEKQIELQMREGIQELYLQYFQILKEAAVSGMPGKETEKKKGKLKQILKILLE